ncbi:hypothetical protein [Deinococcus yunweiensis]|uniref:hypothetical protein n=1 Tax=Deinococcus yunweiensis TaxID=367282 RepID=UPI00398EF085
MPDQLNRSPCVTTPRPLRESAVPAARHNVSLRERIAPDRGNATVREEKRGGVTVTVVDVTVATVGVVNRNYRLYRREVWQGAIDAAQQDIADGKLWGLVEHPKDSWLEEPDPAKGRLEQIWVLYETLKIDGDLVRATGVLIEEHAAGQTMKALLSRKVAVGISSNGSGTVKYVKAKELPELSTFPDPEEYIEVIQDDFRLLTIDAVSDPSDLSGTARQKETHRPQEGHMHKLIKEWLAGKPGLTLEQAKAQFATEYVGVLEKIAQEGVQDAAPAPAPTPTPAPAPVVPPPPTQPAVPATHAESTLEQNVLALNARLEASERNAFVQERTNIAISALEAAQLPRAPKVGDLDLDARFREQLTTAAIAAKDTAEAQALVDQMISERRALMGATAPRPGQRESAGTRAQGVSLPSGNNSAPARQLEGHNPVASARGSIGLR